MASDRQNAPDGVQRKWPTSNGEEERADSSAGYLDFLTRAWRGFLDSFAPMGYEDEDGFNYGERPERN